VASGARARALVSTEIDGELEPTRLSGLEESGILVRKCTPGDLKTELRLYRNFGLPLIKKSRFTRTGRLGPQ
jgi:hypothetical protein